MDLLIQLLKKHLRLINVRMIDKIHKILLITKLMASSMTDIQIRISLLYGKIKIYPFNYFLYSII